MMLNPKGKTLGIAVLADQVSNSVRTLIEEASSLGLVVYIGDTGIPKGDLESIGQTDWIKVIPIIFNNDFSAALNALVAQIPEDYIFRIDTDEHLEAGSLGYICEQIQSWEEDRYGTVYRLETLANGHRYYTLLVRLLPGRGKTRWHGVVHERPFNRLSGLFLTPKSSSLIPVRLVHDSLWTKEKQLWYQELITSSLDSDPDKYYLSFSNDDESESGIVAKHQAIFDYYRSLPLSILSQQPHLTRNLLNIISLAEELEISASLCRDLFRVLAKCRGFTEITIFEIGRWLIACGEAKGSVILKFLAKNMASGALIPFSGDLDRKTLLEHTGEYLHSLSFSSSSLSGSAFADDLICEIYCSLRQFYETAALPESLRLNPIDYSLLENVGE